MDEWFAIRTKKVLEAEHYFTSICTEVYFPKATESTPSGTKTKAVIPHVLFLKADKSLIEDLERQSHEATGTPEFWIYRYTPQSKVYGIPEEQIALLKLLTSDNDRKCEIYHKDDFRTGQYVRVTGGPFAGYSGYVRRVKKNRHVVVSIEGICAVLLPYIHPDFLELQTCETFEASRAGFIN